MDDEKIKKRFLAIGAALNTLIKNGAALQVEYDKLFKQISDHSNSFHSYLVTWVKLEKEMPLQIPGNTRQLVKEAAAASTAIVNRGAKAMGIFKEKRETLFKLPDEFIAAASAISKAFPDENKCMAVIDDFEAVYQSAQADFLKLQSDLVLLQQMLDTANTRFSKVNN